MATGAVLAARWISNDSIFLLADNVRNEVVTIHVSQEVLKLLFLYT
jgi:hypothetical protein